MTNPLTAERAPRTAKRRYTLVFHFYLGYGSYYIEYRKLSATSQELKRYKRTHSDLHFVISGWPRITHPNGKQIDYAK
jgi:hypothetical protein